MSRRGNGTRSTPRAGKDSASGKTRARPRPEARRSYSAPALEKGIDIVQLLSRMPAGLTISEIADHLDRSMSEVFRMVMVLESREWLRKDVETDRYRLTYRVLEVGHQGTPSQSVSSAAAPVMTEIALLTHQSCHLAVLAGGRGLVIHRQENLGWKEGGFSLRLGADVDLVTSCSGHVLLAFSDPSARAATFDLIPPPWKLDRTRLQKILDRVRARGYEIQPSAIREGITDIGYPIFGRDGKLVASLTVPYLRVIDDSLPKSIEETCDLLAHSARRISAILGWPR